MDDVTKEAIELEVRRQLAVETTALRTVLEQERKNDREFLHSLFRYLLSGKVFLVSISKDPTRLLDSNVVALKVAM